MGKLFNQREKNLKYAEMARNIRNLIQEITETNGGHLASNLGVVELSIAFHEVFDSPKDKIIFDVSHQCYAHKILTGRRDRFSTLRQTGGLSGFTSPHESPHDVFYCGHAGTALSSALGMAVARDRLRQNYHVIAVIGDASLTNGLTLEALNHIGKTRLIVVLNDNGYAIAKNVGSIARYLNGIMCSNTYNRFKNFLKHSLRKLPLGNPFIHLLSHAKRLIKAFLLPSSFFEYYGLRYIGPIDGHSITDLVDALKFCKRSKRPLLLHVKTKKGHGDSNAEHCPEKTHGITSDRQHFVGYSQILGQALCDLAEKNPQIVAITAAMAQGTGLDLFQQKFPERFFDVGIAEGHAVTFAAGLAKAGLLPVCAIYSTFLQRAFDNIFHDIALQNLPIIIAIDRAGLCAHDGPTHHGLFDIAFLRNIPHLVIMQPKDGDELCKMLEAAIHFHVPCCIRYPRGAAVQTVNRRNCCAGVVLGQSETIQRGKDICMIALGDSVSVAMAVARKLPYYAFTIINARFIKPLDEIMLRTCAQNCKRIYTLENHVEAGGFGSAIAEFFARENIAIDLHIFAWPDCFIPHASSNEDLEKMFHLTVDDIAMKIENDWLTPWGSAP
ncbi:MAG: 1-deoxy-D-xylulose-5-phosphate synthase [Puniceicoccales bacterium]|jgi:1-deoxy-D-xylulose-5-phosphate synthase|nr:1-deoxy-D-xylulose-5-phosphate synthase [Puniceicoccales bacterium]